MKKLALLLPFLVTGCYFGVESSPRHYHTKPTQTVYYEDERIEYVRVEVEDPNYYEFYNPFGEWCYGERDPHFPACFDEWCFDHIEDWWYEWDVVCENHYTPPSYYY